MGGHLPGRLGRVKTSGYLPMSDIRRSDGAALVFGATMSISATPGIHVGLQLGPAPRHSAGRSRGGKVSQATWRSSASALLRGVFTARLTRYSSIAGGSLVSSIAIARLSPPVGKTCWRIGCCVKVLTEVSSDTSRCVGARLFSSSA